MKKFAAITLSAALLLTLFAGCGAKETAPETTAAPETTLAPETTVAPETEEVLDGTEAVELSELGELIEKIYANHKEVDLPMMTQDLDLANMDLVTMNTGLTSAEKVSAIAVSEPMMGQPFSLVLLKVKDAADAADVAQQVYDGVDQRKWICMEADTKIGGYYDDIVMFFMVGSDFADVATTESMMTAFKAAAGKDVTVIG